MLNKYKMLTQIMSYIYTDSSFMFYGLFSVIEKMKKNGQEHSKVQIKVLVN